MERGSEVRKVSIAECYMFIRTGVYGSDYMKSFSSQQESKSLLLETPAKAEGEELTCTANLSAVHPLSSFASITAPCSINRMHVVKSPEK